ncbi:hypothetical protein [Pseudomonas sp. 58 R 3]|nr:hypothetical protein [Pseudomonas sp. 58 R 3]
MDRGACAIREQARSHTLNRARHTLYEHRKTHVGAGLLAKAPSQTHPAKSLPISISYRDLASQNPI